MAKFEIDLTEERGGGRDVRGQSRDWDRDQKIELYRDQDRTGTKKSWSRTYLGGGHQ
jgi:hypothetical protein